VCPECLGRSGTGFDIYQKPEIPSLDVISEDLFKCGELKKLWSVLYGYVWAKT
jgi:hypothetical protein